MTQGEENVKGPQQHAEGQHGEKTRARFLEQIHESPATEDDNIIATHRDGTHRLDEDRQQHDPAEKNSESDKIDQRRGQGSH